MLQTKQTKSRIIEPLKNGPHKKNIQIYLKLQEHAFVFLIIDYILTLDMGQS